MTNAKPFQRATVTAVLDAFRAGRRYRRFLVADEVGLGKTVVAQHVIRELMRRRSEPLVVFYLCSNLSIAAQNRRKLLEVLPAEERESATCYVDRLALLPGAENRPTHADLHLYCLTPDTSIPMRKGRRRDGRQEERALVHALVEKTFPVLFDEWKTNVFRRSARAWWSGYLEAQRAKARSGALREAFRRSVREEFKLDDGYHLLPAIRDLDDLQLIAHFRNALAASAIEELNPDLVVFDEFQRFRDLLETGDDTSERVMGRLRGEQGENPPALLLLSATPYRLYARRAEEAVGESNRGEFFELVEFLYGGTPQAWEKRAVCENAFAVLEGELRKGEPGSAAAQRARNDIEELLRKIMARTERASHSVGWEEHVTEALTAPIHTADLGVFKQTSRSFQEIHRASAVPYWTSIPLPMQSMGPQYVAWKAAKDAEADGTPGLDQAMRDGYERPDPWPHPRLRALQHLLPPERMVVPWIAPSNPWWELRGPWKDEAGRPRKVLVFSRFRAVPQVVAAALSFDLEARFLSADGLAYGEVTKRRLLAATEGRHALLALFHPCPFLTAATEPLAAGERSPADTRRVLARQIRDALQELGVRFERGIPQLPLWRLLARLDARAGASGFVIEGWRKLDRRIRREEGNESGLGNLLTEWEGEAEKPLESIHPAALADLVQHALSAPGVVVGRALRRHWPEATTGDGYYHTLDAAWTGLRNYLDQRWFFSAFRRRKEKYPQVIQRLVVDGNLEAVLDEHLWITSRLRSLEGKQLADELREGLSVKSGLFFLHPIGDKEAETFSLRCHVAMPFVDARVAYAHDTTEGEGRIRTDQLRKAFNTPFWPYVLATTSVGQEGLDFHVWCDTIAHWDLCRNPVDLEQREGRIQRFGGLSIRRAVVERLGPMIGSNRREGESPWKAIEVLAEEEFADESGLAPWWVCQGGSIKRYVFDVPTSEQRHWLRWVREQRRLYRLVLGQANQEDLVEILAGRGEIEAKDVRDNAINLSPWFGSRPASRPH